MNTLTCTFNNIIVDASIISNNLVRTQDEYENILQTPSCYSKPIQTFPLPLVRADRLIQFIDFPSTDTNCLVQIIHPFLRETEKPLETIFVNIDQLSKKTANILGKNGLERFEIFKKYSKGWDSGCGLPLSHRSVAVMEYFINQFSNFHGEPSLFLTPNGNLQLGWENTHGQIIELEFYSDKIEYYIEALETEGEISLDKKELDRLTLILKEND